MSDRERDTPSNETILFLARRSIGLHELNRDGVSGMRESDEVRMAREVIRLNTPLSETVRTAADEAVWTYCQISATSNKMLNRDDVLRVLRDRIRELDPDHPFTKDASLPSAEQRNTAERYCSCGWPNNPCSKTQTDCLAIQPRREPTTGGDL